MLLCYRLCWSKCKEKCGGTCLLFVISLLRSCAWGLNLPSAFVHVRRSPRIPFQVRKPTHSCMVSHKCCLSFPVPIVRNVIYTMCSFSARIRWIVFLFKMYCSMKVWFLWHSPSRQCASHHSCVCLICWGTFYAVYDKKFTRAHRGSLPTPRQIVQVLIEQEKARGSWRAAWYLRFIFSIV